MFVGRKLVAVGAALVGAVLLAGCGAGAGPVESAGAASTHPAVDRALLHRVGHDGDRKTISLTFDDGPSPQWTPRVLDVLKENDVKAAFCQIAPNAEAHPDLVKRVVAEGHQLCDHSVSHDMATSKKDADYQRREVVGAKETIEAAAGPEAQVGWYRAPGGDFSPQIRELAAANGMRPLGWTSDSEDWKRPGAQQILDTVKQQLKPGVIVLFHDGGGERSQTLAAVKELLPWLKDNGWTVVPLDR